MQGKNQSRNAWLLLFSASDLVALAFTRLLYHHYPSIYPETSSLQAHIYLARLFSCRTALLSLSISPSLTSHYHLLCRGYPIPSVLSKPSEHSSSGTLADLSSISTHPSSTIKRPALPLLLSNSLRTVLKVVTLVNLEGSTFERTIAPDLLTPGRKVSNTRAGVRMCRFKLCQHYACGDFVWGSKTQDCGRQGCRGKYGHLIKKIPGFCERCELGWRTLNTLKKLMNNVMEEENRRGISEMNNPDMVFRHQEIRKLRFIALCCFDERIYYQKEEFGYSVETPGIGYMVIARYEAENQEKKEEYQKMRIATAIVHGIHSPPQQEH